MLDGTVWNVERSTLKRRFQKYVTFINRIIRSRFLSKKPKLKKNRVLVFDHKRDNFQYLQKRKKLPTLICIWGTMVSHKKGYQAAFQSFFLSNGVFNFRNSIKKRQTTHNHLSYGFQKGKNIWNLDTRNIRKSGGGVPRVYNELRPYMYINNKQFPLCFRTLSFKYPFFIFNIRFIKCIIDKKN